MPKFTDKYLHTGKLDLQRLSGALDTQQLSGTASLVASYESALASKFGAACAVAVSSGSTALQAALTAVGALNGAEVLIPAIAPLPTVFPVSLNQAIPVPVDVKPNSLEFEPADLRRKINSKTKAALIVPLWGYPVKLEESLEILTPAGIPLIEDAAHAHGSKLAHQFVGTTGIMGCFSTHDRKLLSTGEGGFILTSDEGLAERLRSYCRLENLSGEKIGPNYKFNALGAALGLSRIQDLDVLIRRRTSNAAAILDRIRHLPVIEIPFPADSVPNYYNLTLLLQGSSAATRSRILELNRRGIPIDQIKYGYDVFYRRKAYSHIQVQCQNAEDLLDRLVQLPVHPNLDEEDICDIADIVSEVLA